jgi:hypothetical protein
VYWSLISEAGPFGHYGEDEEENGKESEKMPFR